MSLDGRGGKSLKCFWHPDVRGKNFLRKYGMPLCPYRQVFFCIEKVYIKTNPKAYIWQNNFSQSGYFLAEENVIFESNTTESIRR